ncbi:MAG: gliding motility-associated C-terminal domain-containing protein, partial [Ekhidna sp.]
ADFTELTGLADGTYTVFIAKNQGSATNPNLGCTVFASFTITSDVETPTLNEDDIRARTLPDTLCVGNSGRITINDADVSGGDLTSFTIGVRSGSATGAHVTGSPFDMSTTTDNSLVVSNLASADYYIIATNNTTGCSAASGVINVADSTRNPQVTLVSLTPDEDCGTGVNAGGIEILIDSQFDDTDHFTVQWFTGSGATAGNEIAGSTSVTLTDVAAGDYSVSVTNDNTDCSIIRNYTITNVPINPSIFDYSVVNNSTCDDDNDGNPADMGSFELLQGSFKGQPLSQAEMTGSYTLRIYNSEPFTASNEIADNDASSPFIFEELSAGSYFSVLTKDDSGCDSDATEFDIINDVQRPIVSIALQAADSTCSSGATPTGALRATAKQGTTTGIDHTDSDYTFQWYLGSGTGTALAEGVTIANGSTPAGVATSNLSGLYADTYTVEVTRISTGCVVLEEFVVPNVPTQVEIVAFDLTPSNQCNPGTGIIAITSVSRDAVTDYDFDYYDSDPTSGSPTPVFTGTGGASYTTAQAGIYWVIGTNTLVNCTTSVYEVEIEADFTIPVIDLESFRLQLNCDTSNPNGYLKVSADGVPATNPDYAVQWYFGNDTSNPLTSDDYNGGANLAGANADSVGGIGVGFYTVEVTRVATGCSAVETFEMTDAEFDPDAIGVSSSTNTNCVNPNGKISATVIKPGLDRSINDYTFYWFVGTKEEVTNTPDIANSFAQGSLVEDIAGNQAYTVLVVDEVDGQCVYNVKDVFVEDATVNPEFEVDVIRHQTVCFDEKDGYAEIVFDGDISSIDTEWYTQGVTGNFDSLVSTNTFADKLEAGIYQLTVTDRITLCASMQQFTIDAPADVVTPTIIVNGVRTNCMSPNGTAVANVDGNSGDFIFEWYDITNPNQIYATGSEVFNLDSATYEVYARSLITGCETPIPAQVTIGFDVTDPVFEVQFNNSICLRTEDGATNQFTGYATIEFEEFNAATDYEWRENNEDGVLVGNVSTLIDAYPGDYYVSFTAENGCRYSATFTIETSLTIYNGISANDDGKNDFFLIDCIDYFPANQVQIFNRAGQKVYEIDGYNNTSVRFDGFSNIGVGDAGLELPTGTYFYVVDLGNGDEPVQGYIEIVR